MTAPGSRRRAVADRLAAHGQEHLLRFADRLSPEEEAAFLAQLEALDLPRLDRLVAQVMQPEAAAPAGRVEPPELVAWGAGEAERRRDVEARAAGEALLAEGKVAAFLVSGGQGTRLGFEGPKGRFPVGPITNRSLFAYHAQRTLAAGRRYGRPAPLYVMTSDANHTSTIAAFREAGFFGLDPADVRFFRQGMLPALDREGRLLLAGPGSLALSPDGHGGALRALAVSGALDDMRERGVEHIFSFQVDNPLAPVLDPVFIGHHVLGRSEMSSKAVAKTDPAEKVGVFARLDGTRTGVVEYSDLDPELAAAREPGGALRFRAGNIAIHLLAVDFVRRLTARAVELPVHRALKAVPCLDAEGRPVHPESPNAIKMEMFLFDALPQAARAVTQEVLREEEFAPVKNAEGRDSPRTAREALAEQARRWMRAAGLAPPPGPAEVGPLFALDQQEFLANLTRSDFGPVFDRS